MTDITHPDQPRATLPFKTVLLSMLGLWLTYFVLTTLRGTIVGIDFQGELLIRRFMVCIGGVLVTFVMWLVLRLFDNKSLLVKGAAAMVIALPAALLIAQINQWAFADIQDKIFAEMGAKQGVVIRRDASGNLLVDVPPPGATELNEGEPAPDPVATVTLERADDPYASWRQLTDIALGRYFLLLAWGTLYLALLAAAQARVAERREGEFRRQAKEAELRSLRYQVNPHFLFNSLNSLSALVMTGKADRAEEMIQTLSSFYRHSLADDTTSDVDLADEFALQQHYLEIEAIRFPDRLVTKIDLPDDLKMARIPGMILQPLIENSVKYAVAPLSRPVTIRVAAREDAGRLVLTVSDDGPGSMDLGEPGFGIGLANVSDRLKARFNTDATIVAGPNDSGYSTEIRVPLRKHD